MRASGKTAFVLTVIGASFSPGHAAAVPGLELRLTWAATPTATVSLDLRPPPTVGDAGTDDGRDAEVQARLTFLRDALEDTERHAQLWAWGWLSFYVVGLGVQGTRAVLTDDRAARADFLVGAVKAGIGITAHALRLPRARLGADDIPEADALDADANLAALALAEAALREDARRARRRYSWMPPVASVLLNLAGGVVVGAGYDDWSRGLTSAALGVAIGQIVHWSQPWQPDGHLEAYRARFGPR